MKGCLVPLPEPACTACLPGAFSRSKTPIQRQRQNTEYGVYKPGPEGREPVPSESNMMRIIFWTLAAATFVLGAPVAQEPDAPVAYETSGQRRMLAPQEDTPGDIEFKNKKEEGIFRGLLSQIY